MKNCFVTFVLTCLIASCHQASKPINHEKTIVIDSSLLKEIEKNTSTISTGRHSIFTTPLKYYFFSNNKLIDSTLESEFRISSWYHSRKDTIDLVAHIGGLETSALLIRFIGQKPTLYFFRASHSGQKFFRLNLNDSFADRVEVPLTSYNLQLSQIPDTVNKPIVFGKIDMKSSNWYDKRDKLKEENKVEVKFYFKSEFRKFNY